MFLPLSFGSAIVSCLCVCMFLPLSFGSAIVLCVFSNLFCVCVCVFVGSCGSQQRDVCFQVPNTSRTRVKAGRIWVAPLTVFWGRRSVSGRLLTKRLGHSRKQFKRNSAYRRSTPKNYSRQRRSDSSSARNLPTVSWTLQLQVSELRASATMYCPLSFYFSVFV
jgi:hypothetical protein